MFNIDRVMFVRLKKEIDEFMVLIMVSELLGRNVLVVLIIR